MRTSRLAGTLLVLSVLALSAPAYADQHHSNLSLTFDGVVLAAGDQSYSHEAHTLVSGMILGQLVDPSQATLEYGVQAHVSGLSVSGEASFDLAINNPDGSVTKVTGEAPITDMVTPILLPLGCTGTSCQSTIPAAYLGLASVSIQTCSHQEHSHSGDHVQVREGDDGENSGCSAPTNLSLPMQFESAYMNPFGGPIVFASSGNEIIIAATYSEATIDWSGSQLGGAATGTLDGSAAFGGFTMTVNAHEDLVAGTESESGSIALVGMFPTSLNANGNFRGHSTFGPGTACDPSLGLPVGTCQITGLSSSGSFSMHGSGGNIRGSYTTLWTAPAIAFTSSVSATVGGGSDHGGD
jgi:hypothetical protein